MKIGDVMDLVYGELQRQHEKWGEQHHDNMTWSAILTEEVGEAAKDALKMRQVEGYDGPPWNEALRDELVQVAAVAINWIASKEAGR